MEFLSSNQSVKSLDLRNHIFQTIITDSSIINHLTYSIPNDEILCELFLWNMRSTEFSIISSGLMKNTCLELLDLQFIQFYDENFLTFIEMIKHNQYIKEILIRSSESMIGYSENLFSTIISSKLQAVTLSNLTKEQGELFIRLLKLNPTHSLERIALSFEHGHVYCDLWEELDLLLPKLNLSSTFVRPSF